MQRAYLFSGEMGRYAAVGSSNLTKSGLSENSELNLASYDHDLTQHIWKAGSTISGSWARTARHSSSSGWKNVSCSGDGTPRGRSCSSLCTLPTADFLEMGLSEEVMGRLAGFQQQAVQRCVALLRRHWGAMLCDSVGLGKTYEGLGHPSESSPISGTMTRNEREPRRGR